MIEIGMLVIYHNPVFHKRPIFGTVTRKTNSSAWIKVDESQPDSYAGMTLHLCSAHMRPHQTLRQYLGKR